MKKRQYDQYCPLACALDIVGERWAMLIVRELLLGPRRFADLETGLPGIGTNTLTTRLDEMVNAGVIGKRRLPAPAAAMVYQLTEWGRGLEPIVHAIARWGTPRLSVAAPKYALRASWLAVALKAFFQSEAVSDLDADVELVLPTGTLILHFDRGTLQITEGEAELPAARIFGTEPGFLQFLTTGNASAAGTLRVEGDGRLLDRLIEAFPLHGEPAR